MQEIEQNSYSYYQLHEKIVLLSLLMREIRKQQHRQGSPPLSDRKFFGSILLIIFISLLYTYCIYLDIFSCNNLSCLSSNVQSKKNYHDITNNSNNNNNNNTPTQMADDEQNHLLEFYVFDVSHERNLNLAIDSNNKRLIIFYNVSNDLHTIGIRNGK